MVENHGRVLLSGAWLGGAQWEFFLFDQLPDLALCTTVACVAIRSVAEQEVVLTYNSAGRGTNGPGSWEMPGGHVDPLDPNDLDGPKETLEQALARETLEEAGFVIASARPLSSVESKAVSAERHGLVLACDIDDTLLAVNDRRPESRRASERALLALCTVVQHEQVTGEQPFYFGSVTGRTLASHQEREAQSLPFSAAASIMDFKVTSVGSEAYVRTADGFRRLQDWPETSSWGREEALGVLSRRSELGLQPPIAQGTHKLSFDVQGVRDSHATYAAEITDVLAERGIFAHVLFSGGLFLDILPQGVHKGTGLRHTVGTLALAHDQADEQPLIIFAGDSMNDCDALQAADMAILPGNAHDSLRQWASSAITPDRLYVAEAPFATGILEGYYHFVSDSHAWQ